MFWFALATIVVGTLLFKLGALTVAFVVMSAFFKITLLVILALVVLIVWSSYRSGSAPWRKP